MKPIEVVKQLVKDNPNNMQLGELVRQYIQELEPPMNWIEGMSRSSPYLSDSFRERKGTFPGLDAILNGANVDE